MPYSAEALRLRARTVERQFAACPDEGTRALGRRIAQAYEALARNEEWLTGEVNAILKAA